MRIRCVAAVMTGGLVMLLTTDANALDAKSISDAPYAANIKASEISPATVRAQILLDRANFSPGEIDGKLGENVGKAIKAYAEANSLPANDKLTSEVWTKLTSAGGDPVVVAYAITADDVKGPFLDKQPKSMEAMKDLKSLSYRSTRERLAERFHMSEELLAEINPKSDFDKAGETIMVANVQKDDKQQAVRLDVNKDQQTVRAYSKSGELLGFFPASVGSDEKPTPSGTLKVQAIQPNPTYRYNPDYKFKSVKSKKPFTIKPGPNNPVGVMWIKLSNDGYGIHGTADPSKVSKSESHGCVRLTNWDALRVAKMLKRGTPVNFIE